MPEPNKNTSSDLSSNLDADASDSVDSIAFFNGEYLPRNQVRLSMWDFGFTMGATVTEQMRTFGGRVEFLDRHLNRLLGGLEICEIDTGLSYDDLAAIVHHIADANHTLIAPTSDLGIGIAITPGLNSMLAPEDCRQQVGPTILVYSYQLPFSSWADHYQNGLHLDTVASREISPGVMPKQLKCRSRMHYYLADRQARKTPGVDFAVLQDADGNLAESTIASIAIVCDGQLIAPPESDVLPSVSFAVSAEILGRVGMKVVHRPIGIHELAKADEVLWFNATRCIVPVTKFHSLPIGDGRPGPVFQQLRTGWLFVARADFVQQAIDQSYS